MKYFLLILIGLALYLPALPNHFVWDDEEQVVANTAVHSLSNIPALLAGSTFNSGGSSQLGGLYYKPLMSISFATIYTVFGPSPWAFHLFQLTLHLGSTLLLYLVLSYLWKNNHLAWLASLIFLIHPQNVEAVVYISALQDTLYLFFGLLGLTWLVISDKRIGWGDIIFSSLCVFLAMLGKETGVLFLPLLALYLFLFRRKTDLFKWSLATILISSLYLWLRVGVAGVGLHKNLFTPMATLPLVDRLAHIPTLVTHYLSQFIYPLQLSISQHWVIPNPSILYWLALFIIAFVWLVIFYHAWRQKNLSLVFFWTWFGLALGFHLQLFPLDMTVADRWFYLPMIGLIGSIGSALPQFPTFSRRGGRTFAIVVLLLLFLRSTIRIRDWHDGLTLYSHDSQIMKESFDLENNLGVELYRSGDLAGAKARFTRSTELAPTWWTNWNNLGVIIEGEGDLDTALSYYGRAIDHGNYYLAYGNYAQILVKQNKIAEATQFVSDSLRLYSDNRTLLDIYQYLSILRDKEGR